MMAFENPEIASGDLPSATAPAWQALDPRFIKRLLLNAALIVSIVLISLLVVQLGFGTLFGDQVIPPFFGWLYLLPVLLAVALFGWPFLSVPRQGFVVRDKDILFKSGVLWRNVTAVPFNRVQHVEKNSTPLDRHCQLANLKIFTAGGSGGDLKINGLSADVAEQLRAFILSKVGAAEEPDLPE